MKKRLLKKWWFVLCSHYCFCTEHLDVECHTACKMFTVSNRKKKATYRFRKDMKHWKSMPLKTSSLEFADTGKTF